MSTEIEAQEVVTPSAPSTPTTDSEMSSEQIVAMMDAMIDNTNHEVKVTADNVAEVIAETSDNSKVEDTKIEEVTKTETDTTPDGSKEDSVDVPSTEEIDPSTDVETGDPEVSEDTTTGHGKSDKKDDETSDDVAPVEGMTTQTDEHYKRLLETLSNVTGTEVSEITPDMLESMYKSAKGLTSTKIPTAEEAMLDKHGIGTNDLALLAELKSGNAVDAVKKLMVENNINPYEVNLEEFDKEEFDNKLGSHSVNPIELKLNGFVQRAETTGVKDVVVDKILAWDETSVLELLDNPDTSSTLLSQIKDGSFDDIMKEVQVLDALNFTDNDNETMMDKYSKASHSLARKKKAELSKKANSTKVPSSDTKVPKVEDSTKRTPSTTNDTAKSTKTPTKKKKTQVVDNEARKEAAIAASTASSSISTSVPSSTNTGKVLDIDKMSAEELHSYMDSLIS